MNGEIRDIDMAKPSTEELHGWWRPTQWLGAAQRLRFAMMFELRVTTYPRFKDFEIALRAALFDQLVSIPTHIICIRTHMYMHTQYT